MFEVEKKFILTDEQQARLLEGAEFVSEKSFTDTYFDNDTYALTLQDMWLRARGDRFELKVPLNVAIEERVSDQYKELETDAEIAAHLGLPTDKPLYEVLADNGYVPFVKLVTARKKYTKDGFGIDLDAVDSGYNIAEIESMTDDESKINEATEAIITFARAHGLTEGPVLGKVVEYLQRNNPAHFQALVDGKVIRLL